MRRLFLLVALSVMASRSALAGSVITTNLPASTAIINIAGTVDGTGSYSGINQDFWYQPFSAAGAGSLLTYTIQPGTYSFTLTNPTLAATQFPALTPTQRSTMFTAWTYNSPWATDYMVFDIAAATNSALPQLFSGAIMPVSAYPGFASANDAFNHSQSDGWGNKIVNAPGGRYTGTVMTTRTFATAQTLVFTVPDNVVGDNQGGVSIVIAPATASGTPGDYNANGIVDASDYTVWRKYRGTAQSVPNDPSGGTIGTAQYATWRSNYGKPPGSGSANSLSGGASVPEPASIVLLLLASAAPLAVRRNQRPILLG